MKHILNNLSEQEKNAIREQHTGGMKVTNENFSKLLNSKLGDSRPFLSEQPLPKKPSALARSMSKPIVGMLPQIKACVAQGGYPKLAEFLKKQENKELDNIVIDMLMTFSVKKDPQASSEIGKLIECLKKTIDTSTVQNKGVNEQAQTYTTKGTNSGGEQYDIKSPFKVGQTIKGKRSTDGQIYTITVAQVGQGFIAGKILGPGTYNNKPLDGKFPWELNTNTPGVLHGNNELGTFTIVTGTQPVQEQQRPADAIEGGGMGINEVMDLAYKFMNEHCPEGPKDANKYKMCISRLHDLFQMSLRNLSGNVSNSEM